MARTDYLSNFLTDIANALRKKKGTTGEIVPSNFKSEIESLCYGPRPGNKVIRAVASGSITAWTFVTKGRHTGGTDLDPDSPTYAAKQISSSSEAILGIAASSASSGETVVIYTMEE